MNEHKNADRFTGFADVYENARPEMPQYLTKIICKYLGKKPQTVVDLGCGTGLSTVSWKGIAENIIGIEPSDDMLEIAKQKADESTSFIKAYSNNTTLPNTCADAVICSQSFHWMEPITTLDEINRILKPNGIFATVDCDWPPIANWNAEKAYMELYLKAKEIELSNSNINDTFVRYDKSKHLQNIEKSGHFRYFREILFANTEECTAQRFVNILLSQGSLQAILKVNPNLIKNDIEKFKKEIYNIYDDKTFDIDFCYQVRMGIK